MRFVAAGIWILLLAGAFLMPGWSILWLAGPLTVLVLLPLLLVLKKRQLKERTQDSDERRRRLEGQLQEIEEELKDQKLSIRSQEEAISGISDLYGLSKQFLATLERDQALRVTEEALMKALPQMGSEERGRFLEKVGSQVEGGELSMESLVSALPAGSAGLDSWERGGIVIGQLALGLKRVSLYRQVQESAIHDGLTGLLARRHFLERLEEELVRASRRNTPLAFLMVDLDNFKQVNDTFGHLVGDLVLREVARLVQSSVREADMVGRYGGEEFGVVLPEAGRALGIQIADRIRDTISRALIQAYDEKIQVTVSVGVSLYPEMALNGDQLIELADQAMYQAKAQGRNQTITAGG